MGKPRKKVNARLSEFPSEGFVVQQGKLWCSICKLEINFERKSSILKHIGSKQHKSRQGATEKVQPLPTLIDKSIQSKGKWSDMVAAFAGAGVPIKAFSDPGIRKWIKTHVTDGDSLPSETTLRKYLKSEGVKDHNETTAQCRGKGVIVIADESMDIKNRKVLNIFVQPALPRKPARLVTTEFLDKCDGVTVSNSVLETLTMVYIDTSQVICLKTDNARYMLTAGNTLKGVCGRLMHSTCWSHVLHLVSEEIRGKLKKADKYISLFKSSLVKAPSQREELLDYLESNGYSRKLPPVPVITRWCTWLETGSFHYLHLEAEINWVAETEDNSVVIHKLKKIANSESLKDELKQAHEVCAGISASIKMLESHRIPSSDVWLQLKSVAGLTEEAMGVSSAKLETYLNGRHPSVEFWKDVQYLDPRKAAFLFQDGEVEHLPSTLERFSEEKIGSHEILAYRNIRMCYKYSSQFSVLDFWTTFSRELPKLSNLALTALSVPASSADVERSFSSLKIILTAQRTKLTEENLGVHLRMSFNKTILVGPSENEESVEDGELAENSDFSDTEIE